jgi:hypothetical protein
LSSLVYTVTGSGRLQFCTAPDFDCPMRSVFVIPRDRLMVYSVSDDGWASVMYFGGARPTGWVRSSARPEPFSAIGGKSDPRSRETRLICVWFQSGRAGCPLSPATPSDPLGPTHSIGIFIQDSNGNPTPPRRSTPKPASATIADSEEQTPRQAQ